jgi:exopolysaccharide biosynthesis WecB/TagA/CpsF family protein
VTLDQISIDALLDQLGETDPRDDFFYVVTPNVDHVVRLAQLSRERSPDLRVQRAYQNARYCVCDSRVLAKLARLFGVHLTVVPGSDLTAQLFRKVIRSGDLVAIVGGDAEMPGLLGALFPDVRFVQHVPPMGLYRNEAAMHNAAQFAARSGARFICLAVGSPQGEALADMIAGIPGAKGCGLCIGASIDFVTGRQKRAPTFLQKLGLEWSYRLVQEPRRLWRRYIIGGLKFVPLVIAWQLQRTKA